MTPWADTRAGGQRVLYSWHGYQPVSMSAESLVRRAQGWSERHRVPVVIGEWDTGDQTFGSRFQDDRDPRRMARLAEMRDAARAAAMPLAFWCIRQPGWRALNTVEELGWADRIRLFPEAVPIFTGG
jgi:hypothetical protein